VSRRCSRSGTRGSSGVSLFLLSNEPQALAVLDFGEELPKVRGDITSREPEREERPEEPAPSPQVAHRDDLNATSSICVRGRTNLPRAPRLEEIRLDHGSPDGVGLRPVVAKPLPNEADRPGISLRHIGPRLASVVDRQMFGVHVPPQVCSARREVTRRFQRSLWARGALFYNVNPRHSEIVWAWMSYCSPSTTGHSRSPTRTPRSSLQPLWRILERSEELVALGDGSAPRLSPPCPGVLEPLSGIDDAGV
jgi:hypothetical protein